MPMPSLKPGHFLSARRSVVVVVSLNARRNQEVENALKALLEDAEDGKILGFTFVAKYGPHQHHAGTAGCYRLDPEQALSATFRMERHLMGGKFP
jgi:hypothetical protein